MTRKGAKNWLNKLYARADITDEYGDMEDMEPYEEAVDMAIKALSVDPCEDAISMSVVEDIKAEIEEYRDNSILANRHDLAAAAENCLMFIDKHISRKASK